MDGLSGDRARLLADSDDEPSELVDSAQPRVNDTAAVSMEFPLQRMGCSDDDDDERESQSSGTLSADLDAEKAAARAALDQSPARPTSKKFEFDGKLQGLRAIAVVLVLLFHAGVPYCTGGFIGVDVFFVLSGYLISSLLLAEIDNGGRISMPAFYARRARRLLPSASATVILTALAGLAFLPPFTVLRERNAALSTALFGANFYFGAAMHVDYSSDPNPSPYLHFWSLAVEEQFYFLWPGLLALLACRYRTPRWAVAILVVVLGVASFVVGWRMSDRTGAFFYIHTRVWELLCGCFVALVTPIDLARSPKWTLPRHIGGFIGA